jgi:hypothetical protein
MRKHTNRSLEIALYAIFAGRKVRVPSVEFASRKWTEFRQETNAGNSEIGNGVEVRDGNDNVVARVSYNGRIWNADGSLHAEAAQA